MAGKNPFAGWQEAKQDRREALIKNYLVTLKKNRMRFEYITDLAETVATYIGEHEGKSCNRATLLRNKRYKAQLLTFMARSVAKGTDAINRNGLADPEAGALVLAAEIGSENLRREVTRLKAYISDLEATRGKQEQPGPDRSKADDLIEDLRRRHTLTCQALLAVLKHFDGLLRSDANARRVMDASTRPHKVVVDERLATPFFEWLQLNRDVGGVA